MSTIRAISTSEGLSRGTALVYKSVSLQFEYKSITTEEIEREVTRLKEAYQKATDELVELIQNTQKNIDTDSAYIFRAQQTIVEDESIKEEVVSYINTDLVSAEVALTSIFDTYKDLFNQMEDGYNKERVLDLEDVYKRLARILIGASNQSLGNLEPNTIIVASELFPSDTANLDVKNVVGFVTEKGGLTSHVSILAKNMGIPSVCGVEHADDIIKDGNEVLLQSLQSGKSMIYINPSQSEMDNFNKEYKIYHDYQELIRNRQGLEPKTSDGHEIILSANIGNLQDIDTVKAHNIKGVGLFRTEFLFMKQETLPDEDMQFDMYKRVAEAFDPHMVIIRTLDIGGDKSISCLNLPTEDNPFLGFRGIRIGLERSEILMPQLRALVRASAHGNVKILVPMIDSIWEIQQIKSMLDAIKQEFRDTNIPFDEHIEMGIMIEIPSVLLLMDDIAKEVDFVSIGTNDLTQYLLAADRLNEMVSSYYKPFHPSVFRAIDMVVKAMHKEKKWVGVCGELGGMKQAIPVLIGLGVDELSMTSALSPEALVTINAIDYKLSQQLAQEVLKIPKAENVELLLIKAYNKILETITTQ